jgi:hypothetical protein
MSLSERIRRHLQSHVVGYLALFVALSGTALALPGKKEVKSNDIANGAVKGKAIAADAVKTAKIRDGSITAPKLGAAAVTGSALADGAVTSADLASDSVIREKIGQGEINGGKLANGAVDSAKVANGSLQAADFEPGQISDGFSITSVNDFSTGTVVAEFGPAPYNAPRSGRLLITASMISNSVCTSECDDLAIALFIDGTYAPGSTRESAVGVGTTGGTTSVSTSALVPVAAGPHQIEIRGIQAAGDTQGLANEQITGVLLQ